MVLDLLMTLCKNGSNYLYLSFSLSFLKIIIMFVQRCMAVFKHLIYVKSKIFHGIIVIFIIKLQLQMLILLKIMKLFSFFFFYSLSMFNLSLLSRFYRHFLVPLLPENYWGFFFCLVWEGGGDTFLNTAFIVKINTDGKSAEGV